MTFPAKDEVVTLDAKWVGEELKSPTRDWYHVTALDNEEVPFGGIAYRLLNEDGSPGNYVVETTRVRGEGKYLKDAYKDFCNNMMAYYQEKIDQTQTQLNKVLEEEE